MVKNSTIQGLFGFNPSDYVAKSVCVPAPIGCGGEAKPFASDEDEVEYKISGLCSKCQSKYFSKN